MMDKMTEEQIKELDFELVRQYNHDQFHTNKYNKGALMVEFTYEGEALLTVDMTIEEVFCKPITLDQLKVLVPILGDE